MKFIWGGEVGLFLVFAVAATANGGDPILLSVFLALAALTAVIALAVSTKITLQAKFGWSIVVILFLCAEGVGLRLHSLADKSSREPPPLTVKSPAPENRSTDLFADCSIAAAMANPSPTGAVKVLALQPYVLMSGEPPPGFDEEWGQNVVQALATGNRTVYRCEVTNYRSTTLFDLLIAMHYTFFKVYPDVANKYALHSAGVTHDFISTLPIPKLDPGPAGAFAFYVVNYTDHRAALAFAGSATFVPGPGQLPQKITVLFEPNMYLDLWPVFPASPSTTGASPAGVKAHSEPN